MSVLTPEREMALMYGATSLDRSPLMLRRSGLALAAAALLNCVIAIPASADAAVRVAASIKPVHSLVSAVMAGVGEPHLIIRGAVSPHTFSMRPSDASVLENARVIFLIGESLETSLARPIDTLAGNARVIALSQVQGLVRRPLREGGAFEAHGHGTDDDHGRHEDEEHEGAEHEGAEHEGEEHEGEEHEGVEHEGVEHEGVEHEGVEHEGVEHEGVEHEGVEHEGVEHEGVEHAKENVAAHGDDDHDAHRRGAFDMHIWLDPVNAGVMARAIAGVLSEADPANAGTYAANAQALLPRLEELTAQIAAEVAPVRGKPFIVFHDGYRYFEDRFGLTAAGSSVVSPDRSPGVRRISELRDKVRELGVTCVFAEPQFEPRLIDVIIEGTAARTGTVDPLGATIESGPELYFTLIHNMAASFKSCLTPAGQD